jgi:16S rRNA (cytidine1402-2'-O)-methyltransferase
MTNGKLFLIPTFLTDQSGADSMPSVNILIIADLNYFIVENIRSARRFLRSVGYMKDFNEVMFYELNEHTEPAEVASFIKPLLSGDNMGLISEAGTPCIADPGAEIVLLAHQNDIRIVPLTGPNSILLALMASGLNGQQFTFHGYLPIEKNDRNKLIRSIEKDSLTNARTQIFIETPYRNNQLFDALINNCNPGLKLCVACQINSDEEFIKTLTIKEWKKQVPDLHKKPAVFLINF